MTASVVSPPFVRRLPPVLAGFGAIAQLAAVAVVGAIPIIVLSTLFSVGLGTLPVFGVGLLFLISFVYALWATSWLEYARVDGLYDLGLPRLVRLRADRPGFVGFLRLVWRQGIDAPMWRGIGSAALAFIFGGIVLALVTGVFVGGWLLLSPLTGSASIRIPSTGIEVAPVAAIVIGSVIVLLAIGLLIGLASAHRAVTKAILLPSREQLLAERARTAGLQREGAVRAGEVERTRIERDLHDGVQPRLVSVGMTLGLAQKKIDEDPAAAKALLAEAHTSTKAAITELRQLARGIHASVLDDRGLDAALSALAARTHLPVDLDVRMEGRCSRAAESAVYFTVAESLTNAAKHSRASSCRVLVRRRPDGTLWARVEDDGIGGAVVTPGGGLDGISNRVLGAGGTIRLDSPAGGPTSIEVSVPCAS